MMLVPVPGLMVPVPQQVSVPGQVLVPGLMVPVPQQVSVPGLTPGLSPEIELSRDSPTPRHSLLSAL